MSGPLSSPRLLPRVPRGCSHSPSILLQGDNHEGDPGCAGSPGLPGPPGLPGQRGEEVRVWVPTWAGPRGGWCLHLDNPRFLRAVSFLPAVSLGLLVPPHLPPGVPQGPLRPQATPHTPHCSGFICPPGIRGLLAALDPRPLFLPRPAALSSPGPAPSPLQPPPPFFFSKITFSVRYSLLFSY